LLPVVVNVIEELRQTSPLVGFAVMAEMVGKGFTVTSTVRSVDTQLALLVATTP
jgi:hypothetical protein